MNDLARKLKVVQLQFTLAELARDIGIPKSRLRRALRHEGAPVPKSRAHGDRWVFNQEEARAVREWWEAGAPTGRSIAEARRERRRERLTNLLVNACIEKANATGKPQRVPGLFLPDGRPAWVKPETTLAQAKRELAEAEEELG